MTQERLEALGFMAIVASTHGIYFAAYANGAFDLHNFRECPILWSFAYAHYGTN